MFELEDKAFCLFGLPDSGKSTLACYILNQFGSAAFVYDTLSEYPPEPFDSYAPKNQYDVEELESILRAAMRSRRYKLIVIDECSRFCPSKPAPLPQAVADLNDWRAHYGIAAGYIARRPVQLNQDLTELSHYIISFALKGKNDIQYLNDLSAGLGDTVSQLELYSFVVVDPLRNYQVFKPIPASFKTDKKMGA